MFEPIPQERAFETIAKQLRQAIYSEEFKTGDKLPTERELAKLFNVSRAAVRSAILNLEQFGLIQIKKGAGGGFFVRELDFEPFRNSLHELINLGKASVSHLAEVRGILEPEVTRIAAIRAEPQDLLKMEKSIADLWDRMSDGLPRRPGDFNFHVCVAEGTKNPAVIFLMRALTDIMYQTIGAYRVDPENNKKIIDQHRQIFNAIKSKNPLKAQSAASKHVEAMKKLFWAYENVGESNKESG